MKIKILKDAIIQALWWLVLGNIALAIITILGVISLIYSHRDPWIYYPVITAVYSVLVYISYRSKYRSEYIKNKEV
jgi:uncharacterized membrane protein